MNHTEKYLLDKIERVREVIASMKSNTGSHAEWIAQLEQALDGA